MDVRDKRRIITMVIIAGLICIAMVVMKAQAAELRCDNNALIAKNEALKGEVATLHIKIRTENNIEHIENMAKNKLGMVYPTQDDCIYLKDSDAPGSNFASVIKHSVYN